MRKYKHRNRRKNNKQKIIVITTVCLLLIMTVGYASFSTNINITAKGNILEQSRVIQSWPQTSNEDFHTDYYRENIVSATFLDNNNVPNNATESWNVSEDKNKGGVMAWVVPSSEDSTKYDLYIGAKGGVIANENSSYLFAEFISIISIQFNKNFDTSNASRMRQMFYHCSNLETVDLSNFDTSNVTDMYDFISAGNKLTVLDLTSFDTSNVTTMYHMFSAYYREVGTSQSSTLVQIIFGPKFNTSKVTNMADMFAGLTELTTIDLSGFDTSNVITMYHMFYRCNSLTNLNLCSFDTRNTTNMQGMFFDTSQMQKIKVGPNWTTSNANTTSMFANSGVSGVTTGQC